MESVEKIRKFKGIIWIVVILLLMTPCVVGASTNTILVLAKSFVRISSSSADAYVHATCAAPSKIVSEVTREIYDENEGDYVTDSSTYRKTRYNATSITHHLTLPVQSTGNYRIKIQITDTYNDITTTVTSYAYLQDAEEDVLVPGDDLDALEYDMKEENL